MLVRRRVSGNCGVGASHRQGAPLLLFDACRGRPRVITTDIAGHCLRKHWGLEGTLTRLDGEQDANFQVNCSDGRTFVLKIMHEGCDPQDLDFRICALHCLESADARWPAVVPANSGDKVVTVEAGGTRRLAWLLTWCTGRLLATVAPHTEALAESFGALLADTTNRLEGFQHPHMRQGHRWELTRALDNAPWISDIEGECRQLASEALQDFGNLLAPKLEDLPWSVVHNDANDYNVLVNGGRVTGLIDFGDLAWQPVICDVAIALAYYLLDKEQPLEACAAFLRGYHAVRKLSEAELALLFGLIKTRLAVSLAISSHRQAENPDDPYIVVSQAPARRALQALAGIPEAVAEATFRQACGLTPHRAHSISARRMPQSGQ